jgi:YgiT-type zinc finger domain-containing protein
MKCTESLAAKPVTKYRGEVPYWYKDHTTTIHGVSQLVCLHCGYQSIPPGHVKQWLEQSAQFRAEIDAQEPAQEPRPESLKDRIMVEWLDLDPDRLVAELPVEESVYIRWKTLANYAKQHRNKAFEAFAGYKRSHTTIGLGVRT